MVNIITIAKKEFSDLISNGMVILVLGVYLLFLVGSIYIFNDRLSSGHLLDLGMQYNTDNFGVICSAYIFYMLRRFGAILGVIIGCASISNELRKDALNVLAVKPVYRDTIINGKLLGGLSFIVLIMAITAALYTAGIMIISGNAFAPYLLDYLGRTVVGFAVLTIFIGIFMALSMSVSLIVRNQAFSLMIGMVLILFSKDMITTALPGTVDLVFSGSGMMIQSLSPDGLLKFVMWGLFGPAATTAEAITASSSYLTGLLVFFIVSLVLSYIVFMRRDIL